MAKITIEELSGSLKEYLNGLGLTEAQVQELIDKFEDEKIGDISQLSTEEKGSLVGAINELFQNANNGKELIANAIGEPLSSEDTFSAMSNDINSLLSSFKTNMMNNGVTVESSDRFKSLIDKIATMVEEGSGKGIQIVEGEMGTFKGYSSINVTKKFTDLEIPFNPTIFFIICDNKQLLTELRFHTNNCPSVSQLGWSGFFTNVSDTQFTFNINLNNTAPVDYELRYVAIGVGEEDTTLRDSLASILQEEGVSVTEEDDMASLISKVNEEFDRQVVPAGDAVASNVLSGKTFINSTGQTITGTMANNGTKTITPKASAQTLGAGYYDKVTINGDADLVAANIVSGKNIFGVNGTAIVQTTVKAGNTYYMVDNITMTALDSIRKYGGYLNASDYMVNNNNYILYKYNSPVTGKVRISYNISSESKHYKHQLKVYNKSGTVTWKSTELVITSGSIITNDISVEIGGLIEVCWLGNNYGQSTGVTTGPSKTKIENICITYSL